MRLSSAYGFTALLLLFSSTFVNAIPIHSTNGVFLYSGSAAEQALAEQDGDITGVGTSVVTTGIGFCDPNFPNPFRPPGSPPDEFTTDCPPNKISFDGIAGAGSIPDGTFNMGTVTFFNADIGSINIFVEELILSISAENCDTELGCDPASAKSGSTLLKFIFTVNSIDDLAGSSDSFCVVTLLGEGPELCAWTREFATQSFDIIAEFGSLNVVDIVPASAGGFVTQGQDPNQNVIHAAVPEPATLALFGFGLAGLCFGGRRKIYGKEACAVRISKL